MAPKTLLDQGLAFSSDSVITLPSAVTGARAAFRNRRNKPSHLFAIIA
jgi:hypothetical protein